MSSNNNITSTSIVYEGNALALHQEKKWDDLYVKYETRPNYNVFGDRSGLREIYTFIPKDQYSFFQHTCWNTFSRIVLWRHVEFKNLPFGLPCNIRHTMVLTPMEPDSDTDTDSETPIIHFTHVTFTNEKGKQITQTYDEYTKSLSMQESSKGKEAISDSEGEEEGYSSEKELSAILLKSEKSNQIFRGAFQNS